MKNKCLSILLYSQFIEIENKILLDGSGKIFNVEVKM